MHDQDSVVSHCSCTSTTTRHTLFIFIFQHGGAACGYSLFLLFSTPIGLQLSRRSDQTYLTDGSQNRLQHW